MSAAANATATAASDSSSRLDEPVAGHGAVMSLLGAVVVEADRVGDVVGLGVERPGEHRLVSREWSSTVKVAANVCLRVALGITAATALPGTSPV